MDVTSQMSQHCMFCVCVETFIETALSQPAAPPLGATVTTTTLTWWYVNLTDHNRGIKTPNAK